MRVKISKNDYFPTVISSLSSHMSGQLLYLLHSCHHILPNPMVKVSTVTYHFFKFSSISYKKNCKKLSERVICTCIAHRAIMAYSLTYFDNNVYQIIAAAIPSEFYESLRYFVIFSNILRNQILLRISFISPPSQQWKF